MGISQVGIYQRADLTRPGNSIRNFRIKIDISAGYSDHDQPPSHSTIRTPIVIATTTPENGMAL